MGSFVGSLPPGHSGCNCRDCKALGNILDVTRSPGTIEAHGSWRLFMSIGHYVLYKDYEVSSTSPFSLIPTFTSNPGETW